MQQIKNFMKYSNTEYLSNIMGSNVVIRTKRFPGQILVPTKYLTGISDPSLFWVKIDKNAVISTG